MKLFWSDGMHSRVADILKLTPQEPRRLKTGSLGILLSPLREEALHAAPSVTFAPLRVVLPDLPTPADGYKRRR